ncbi:MAG: hypothetical protein ACYC4R_05605 [Anaerolineae bacterium]
MTSVPAVDRLSDLSLDVRKKALEEVLRDPGAQRGAPQEHLLNLHCHTFFSYNGYGYSPAALAWLAWSQGWHAVGTVDFDVLDHVEETLQACDQLAVRGVAGVETRTYFREFAEHEINSPGEPGVCYFVGTGFTQGRAPAPADAVFSAMRRRAEERNRDLVARVNAFLEPVTIDYDREVLPMTPAGNATERHILVAYDVAARRQFPRRVDLLAFWSGKLGVPVDKLESAFGEQAGPNELVRSRLMKRGGVGYVQPGPDTFPPLDEVNDAIIACGAIPCCAWLDGASSGEQRMEEMLTLLVSKGVGAVTIVPDRNWNYADPAKRQEKVSAFYALMDLARALDLPTIGGTEMNKPGQLLVDDMNAEALRPLRGDFVRGADFVYGHTLMQRALGLGYQSAWARAYLPGRRARNAFYSQVGAVVAPGRPMLEQVARLDAHLEPAAMLTCLGSLG